jgi:hypothetical protein
VTISLLVANRCSFTWGDEHAMSELTRGSHAYSPRGHPLTEAHRDFACTIVAPWVSWLDRLGARELSEVPE